MTKFGPILLSYIVKRKNPHVLQRYGKCRLIDKGRLKIFKLCIKNLATKVETREKVDLRTDLFRSQL